MPGAGVFRINVASRKRLRPGGGQQGENGPCGLGLRQCNGGCLQRTKIIDSGEKTAEITEMKKAVNRMLNKAVIPPSSLPSLMMPCPVCAGRMVYNTKRP